jgi:hypothetical protein
MRVGLRKIREIIGWLNLPNEIQWLLYVFRHYMLPAVAAGMTGTYTVFQDAPLWQVAVVVGGVFASLFLLSFPAERLYWRWRSTDRSDSPQERDSGTTINIRRIEGSVHISGREQSTAPSTEPEPKVSPDRYCEDATISIADLPREIMLGNEVVRDRTFKNCRILGPAVLFVQEPKRPMTFIGCEWAKKEEAFSVMRPEEHPDESNIILLHQCLFWGCRFTEVEIVVSQETYNHYINGETAL